MIAVTIQEWDTTADRAELDALRLQLGTQLATYRRAAGISQPELGANLGKTRNLVSKIEHGQRGMPAEQWQVADHLCRAEGALVAGHTELLQAEQAYRDRCRAQRRAAQRAQAQAELHALKVCPAPQLHLLSGLEAPPELALVSGELAEEFMQVVRKVARSLPRREAMQVGKWVLTTLGLIGLDSDECMRVARALAAPRRVDGQVVQNLATALAQCQHLEDTLGPAEVLDTVISLRGVGRHLLAGGAPERLCQPLLVLDSKTAATIGGYLVDMGNNGPGQRYFQRARIAGHDARSASCAAYAAANMSFSAFLRGETHTALDTAAAARSLAARTDDVGLKALAERMAAGAYALDGQYGSCMAACARGHEFLDSGNGANPGSLTYWEHHTLDSHMSNFLSKLGRPRQAVEAANNSVQRFDQPYGGYYAWCTLRLGNALVLCEEIDEAARVLADAATVASQSPSTRLLEDIHAARTRLQPWQGTPAVTTLDAQLHARGLTPKQGRVT